jgi:selenocysteine lyase/cysteine desulfurase
VKEDLQGSVIQDLSHPGYVNFNYAPWVSSGKTGDEFPYHAPKDAGRYQPGNVSYVGYAGMYEALQRMLSMGIENIYAHTRPMCDRLKKELPALGHKLITPVDARSSLVVVQVKDQKTVRERLQKAGIQVTTAGENRIRISPAVYNNMSDIDRLLAALS